MSRADQIAKMTGLGLSTVYRALGNDGSVAPASMRAVRGALARLDGGCDVIVMNVPTLSNSFYNPIIEAARQEATATGRSLVVTMDDLGDVDPLIKLAQRLGAVGLIVANHVDDRLTKRLESVIPTVAVSEGSVCDAIPYVSIDNVLSAQMAVGHLLDIGRRRIAMMNGPLSFDFASARLEGYKRALEARGLRYDRTLVRFVSEAMDWGEAKAASHDLLLSSPRPDAFFCVSDRLAAAAIKACQEAGLSVPRDVAVCGHDRQPFGSFLTPSLTTVSQPVAQLGRTAVRLLLAILAGERPESVILPSELIVRHSTIE